MKTAWNDADYQELCTRLDRLQASASPKWGRMTAPQMLCHCTDALRMVSGAVPTAPKNVPIRFPPLKQLIIYWLPWPKGVPTAPELLARAPSEWHGELVTLREELAALVKRGRSGPFVPHPAFGRLTPRAWGVLVYRHLDHHLRQFGV